MFTITIQALTIEAAISTLAAIRAAGITPEVKPETTKDAAAPAPKSAEKEAAAAASTKPTAAADKTPKADAPKAKEEPSVVPYDTVSAAISAAAKTSREATLATLMKFGAKNGKELKPEQYTEFLAALADATKPAEELG